MHRAVEIVSKLALSSARFSSQSIYTVEFPVRSAMGVQHRSKNSFSSGYWRPNSEKIRSGPAVLESCSGRDKSSNM